MFVFHKPTDTQMHLAQNRILLEVGSTTSTSSLEKEVSRWTPTLGRSIIGVALFGGYNTTICSLVLSLRRRRVGVTMASKVDARPEGILLQDQYISSLASPNVEGVNIPRGL